MSILIGQPTSVESAKPLTEVELQQFLNEMNKLVVSGIPPEVPVAIPSGPLIQLAKTVLTLRAEIASLKGLGEPLLATTPRLNLDPFSLPGAGTLAPAEVLAPSMKE